MHGVRTFDTTSEDISPLHNLYQQALASRIPGYTMLLPKFRSLLSDERCKLFVVEREGVIVGFALTALIRSGSETCTSGQHLKGSLVLLIVHPDARNRGIGSALHEAALDHLTRSVKDSLSLSRPVPHQGTLQLGSIFPRFFPGVPDGPEFDEAVRWFTKRSWKFNDHKSIDLYRPIAPGEEIEIEAMTRKATENGISFRSPKPEEDAALYELQRTSFDTFTGWPDSFPALIKSGHRDDVWCAFKADGTLIGATIAALRPVKGSSEEENTFHANLAFPSGLGERCGVIACVGVSPAHQKLGAGIALVATALKYLAERGADGCFIDWVHLQGFYEKMGFRQWERSYREAEMVISAETVGSHETA